jgi:subtilisin-like proprotein convertase family protein
MPAANHNITIEQGSAFEIVFEFINNNNLPIDLTNWCAILQWIDDQDNTEIFNTNYDGDDYRMFVDSLGKITLQIPAKITKDYNFDSATYDLDLQEPNEQYPNSGLKTYRLSTGTVTLLKRNTPPVTTDCANVNSDFDLDTCNVGCENLDPYAVVYEGSSVVIADNATTTSTISVTDSRSIENIDVAINGLRHSSPQDLIFVLESPNSSLDSVLLSMNSKISNYKPGFSFVFSDRAPTNVYLNNVLNNKSCRITNKSTTLGLTNFDTSASFSHLIGQILSGLWKLHVIDSDTGVAGTIDGWKLIITYSDT